MNMREWLNETVDEILLADGFDEALIGFAQRVGEPTVAIYDRAKCIELLVSRDGLTVEEAEEHFNFNVSGGWVGPQTPMFVVRPE